MRVRIWETVKTVLILILLCTLAIMSASLISELVTGRSLTRRLGEHLGWIEPELAYTQTGTAWPAAAAPLAISMTGENGRGSITGDPARTAELYSSLSRPLGEALATASLPVALDEQSWTDLFGGESVTVLYPGKIPLEPLAQWLGAEPSDGLSRLSASHLTLCVDGQQVSLLLPGDGNWLCLSTAVSPDLLRQTLASCRPDGSLFALEDETFRRIDPLSLLTVSTVLPQAAADNPLAGSDRINAAAELLGLNPYTDTAYTAANGTVSFTAGTGRLRVTGSGTLTWQAAIRGPAASGDTALIESARQLLSQLSDGLTGEASLQLSGFEREQQTVTVFFDYVLGGCPVRQSSGHGAVLVYENGALRELTWIARRYTFGGTTQTLLPARLEAAIVAEGTYLEPVYLDSGSSLACGWYALP